MNAVTLDSAPAPAPSAAGGPPVAKPSLAGLDRAGLAAALQAIGVPASETRMRVSQLNQWLYVRGARTFSAMTNVSKHLRAALAAAYTLDRPEIVTEQVSADGTRKWLLRMPPSGPHDKGAEIETVYIPDESRGTLCVSSQVGCTLTCTFCHTGTQKLVRNLDRRRDRRPAPGGARPPRRLAGRVAARGCRSCPRMAAASSPMSC